VTIATKAAVLVAMCEMNVTKPYANVMTSTDMTQKVFQGSVGMITAFTPITHDDENIDEPYCD
jgi:hypothetical protein